VGVSQKPCPVIATARNEAGSNPEKAGNYRIASSFLLTMTTGLGFRDIPFFRENDLFSTDMSSLTGFFRENDLFFYRHVIPDGIFR
jgi:hypothetical protein